MTLDALRHNRELFFWTLHVVGWSGYGIAQYLGALVYAKPVAYQALILVAAVSGFVLSAPLRWLYRGLWQRGPSPLWLAVPLICWIVALTWRAIINLSVIALLEPDWNLKGNPLELFSGTLSSTWLLLCWTGLYFGIKYYETLQQQREAALQATALAQEAQLKMLRYQLNPHFLFNTLNAISTLVLDQQNRVANQAVTRLSDFLRYTLDQDPMKKVTLRQELDALDLYLGIEKLRFGPRLRLDFQIERAAEGALVPSLLLQPLAENALKYAVSPREEGGALTVTARVIGSMLELVVADDGPGLAPGVRPGNGRGVGLRNTRDRLQVLYGDTHRFVFADAPRGVRIEMSFPLERAREAA